MKLLPPPRTFPAMEPTETLMSTALLTNYLQSCHGLGSTFGFDIHHRFSDVVTGILGVEGLPEKGSLEYYVAMAHRDRLMRGRHLAATNNQSPPLTFADGNETHFIPDLGNSYYASVSVGTPSVTFLVALDTGSDLFWLPCECQKYGCETKYKTSSGKVLNFNIYSPESSSTSQILPCTSTLCASQECFSTSNDCFYQIEYVSANTSTTGFMVQEVLHLVTDDGQSKAVDAQIMLGCGVVQTGVFLTYGSPNGLFGLGMSNGSVPSILAGEGTSPNSFVMCFTHDGPGRISFGNNGSSDQGETPFQPDPSHYYIGITDITVGSNSSATGGLSAFFDTGTSFTMLKDPAYTFIGENFNSQVQEKRHSSDPEIPFEYCYDLRPNQTSYQNPDLNLTMESGAVYFVSNPTEVFAVQGGYIYCLAIQKSEDTSLNIIGQNFMTNYNLVFDRDRMVLGWTWTDNCYGTDENVNSTAPSSSPSQSPGVPSPPAVKPRAPPQAPTKSDSPKLKSFTCALIMIVMLLVSFTAVV
ncbi:Aspartic proteinase-like protein 1 [Morella rubra]|uniref:Aspartic proteinase-like protein 1 n=1 Tax=Morella rubra TaxID=262757 RepID=A0A6A1UNE0_9ROSI|nr:Aspartic proteinase-like protein 1 [Morella rubra]